MDPREEGKGSGGRGALQLMLSGGSLSQIQPEGHHGHKQRNRAHCQEKIDEKERVLPQFSLVQ